VGVIFTYDPENDIKTQKIADVPEASIIARIEGIWTDKIYYSLGSGPVASATLDVGTLLSSKNAALLIQR